MPLAHVHVDRMYNVATFESSSKQLKILLILLYYLLHVYFMNVLVNFHATVGNLKLLYQQVTERSRQKFEMYGSHVDCDMKSFDVLGA